VQSEKFIFIFDRAWEQNFAFKDHVKLREVVTTLDHTLVGCEDATIQLWNELGDEFIACLQSVTVDLMFEQVVEIVVNEPCEQTVHNFIAECRLKLE